MRLLFDYLKQHQKGILCFFLFSCIFSFVFFLYSLPIKAVIYSAMVCVFIGFIVLLLDFSSYYKRHKQLQQIHHEIKVTLARFPNPRGVLEEDYQNMIESILVDKVELRNKMNAQYKDLVEYYTIWAHQIKTPIAAMSLMLQNENTPLSKELSEDLMRIEQYVEMVLCYLRLDSDSSDYVIQEYDLDSMIKPVVRKFASQFIRKKIRLAYEPINCNVLTDEKWLSFVIEQVLSNALKYTKSGTITIRLENPKTLCICDTGIGIAPEDLPRIFEKGYTGYNGRSDKKASGIGLYLCRRICEKLGHSIDASSEINEGTRIQIHLEHVKIEVE